MAKPPPVKGRRRYDSSGRRAAAEETRRRVLYAARDLFAAQGYAAVTMRAIADTAGVSPKTIEAAFGTKAHLLKLVVDISIAGDDQPVALADRPVIQQLRDEPDIHVVLVILADLVAGISRRMAPIARVIDEAAPADPEIADLARAGRANRRNGAQNFARLLATKARLRVDEETAADVLWMLHDPTLYQSLAAERGWTHQRFQHWLADTYNRLLIADNWNQDLTAPQFS